MPLRSERCPGSVLGMPVLAEGVLDEVGGLGGFELGEWADSQFLSDVGANAVADPGVGEGFFNGVVSADEVFRDAFCGSS